jgi:hypothetical protein
MIRGSEGKRRLGCLRLRLEDSMKFDLREVGWEGLHWIHVAQERENWRAVLDMEIDPLS